ncbi:Reverse transcriptase domain [Trinorchestia longiramus]|nr:Reverse transcriptase domain [Trinorchestia longiramus]
MGVLYKLSRCGVRETMLRWLQAYLKDRPFKVFMEGTYSSGRIARSGVPRGAVLSPWLFNIMMYDMPVEEGICSCEYADLAFYTQHTNLCIAMDTLQQQLTALHNWSKQWGLKINFNKTKCMLFTNKRINPLSITVGVQQLEFTKQFKYLGVMDSPQLHWHHQVEYLKQFFAPLLNLLQSISHRHWGADRELLIYLYKTLIRSLLDYAAPLYGTAVLSNLLQLNSIQNHCLRIATGCQKTSAASLEVEANIFPLTIHRDLLTCQYYCKLQQLPNDMADELLQAQFPADRLSSRLLLSMKSHARALFTNVNLQIPARNTALVLPFPPWFKVETYISHEGIPGNEAADEAAKNAHLLRYRTLTPSSNEEVKNLINTPFKTKWKTEWLRSIQLTGKGRHLLKIRGSTGQWPWSAHKTGHIETALARLRVGHTGLRSHLYRFSIVEDPYCSCGAEESIDHIFFSCPYYAAERTTMKNSFTPLNVPFCLKNLLGGGLFLEPAQKQIVKIVANYLTSIRKIKII